LLSSPTEQTTAAVQPFDVRARPPPPFPQHTTLGHDRLLLSFALSLPPLRPTCSTGSAVVDTLFPPLPSLVLDGRDQLSSDVLRNPPSLVASDDSTPPTPLPRYSLVPESHSPRSFLRSLVHCRSGGVGCNVVSAASAGSRGTRLPGATDRQRESCLAACSVHASSRASWIIWTACSWYRTARVSTRRRRRRTAELAGGWRDSVGYPDRSSSMLRGRRETQT
jgi:hypothetical protein